MADYNEEEVVTEVVDHLKWMVEDKKRWKQPVCGAADYLLDAYTRQMQEIYRLGRNQGLEEARQISKEVESFIIRQMRDYAKKHPKTTLESYLKRNYPEES